MKAMQQEGEWVIGGLSTLMRTKVRRYWTLSSDLGTSPSVRKPELARGSIQATNNPTYVHFIVFADATDYCSFWGPVHFVDVSAQNYNAYLDGKTGKVSNKPKYSDPSFYVGVGGKVDLDLSFYARLWLTADFEFSYSILDLSGDVHMKLQLRGGYKVSFRMDLTIDAYLQLTIAKLLQYSEKKSRILWVKVVPILYDPFMVMDVVVKTEPLAFSAGVAFNVEQAFTVGYYHDMVWDSCLTKKRYETVACHFTCATACMYDECLGRGSGCLGGWSGYKYSCNDCIGGYDEDTGYIQKFGELKKSAEVSLSVGGDTDDDGCPDALQHFGFSVSPQIKVGAVLYALVAVYAKPELEFPFKLTMPQSDGRTCGNGASYDMCSASGRKQASWSIEGAARFKVGYHVQSLNDMVDRIWTQYTGQDAIAGDVFGTWSTWLQTIQEFQIGGDLSFGTLGKGCFELPSVLDNFYEGLCCKKKPTRLVLTLICSLCA